MWEFLQNPITWVVVVFVAMMGYRFVPRALKRFPIVNNKRTLAIVGLIMLAWTLGLFASLGSWGTASVAGTGIAVTDLQVTTDFNTSTNGSSMISENSNQDDLIDARFNDAHTSESASQYEIHEGLITVTRAGDLSPNSCPVTAIVPPKYEDESAPTGQTYNIVEQDNIGNYEVYLADGAAASASSPKETVQLSFSDGEASTTLGVLMEVDEEGHDALDQYSYKDVVLDVCGKPYTFRIHRMTA